MLTRETFINISQDFYDWCEYPAVKYKVLYHFLDVPYEDERLNSLRKDFLNSDIVMQLYQEQLPNGSWGPMRGKDYSCKSVFPTTFVALDRCFYLGLTIEDKDILFLALEYLEEFLQGTSRTPLYDRNERAIPVQLYEIATYIEKIKPNHSLCDALWKQWHYIAEIAFSDGEYSYERDKKVQHEILLTREDRLVPLPLSLLLTRPEQLPRKLNKSMLDYFGRHAYEHGNFWDKSLVNLPEQFVADKTRRYFHTIKYINQFRDTKKYLQETMDWLLKNKMNDGFWDYGTQVKDPWGYFGYFSTNRNYKYNKVVDCTMEVLSVMKKYLDQNER